MTTAKIEPGTPLNEIFEKMIESIGYLSLVEYHLEAGNIALNSTTEKEKEALMAVLVAARKYTDQRQANVEINDKKIILS